MNSAKAEGSRGRSIAIAAVLVLGLIIAAGAVGVTGIGARPSETSVPIPWDAGASAVSGRCVDENGIPLAGVSVQWMAMPAANGSEGSGGRATPYDRPAPVITDSDGSFLIERLPAADGVLQILENDGRGNPIEPPREGRSKVITTELGSCASGIELEVRKVSKNRIIRGRLLDAAGEPREFVMIKARHHGMLSGWQSGTATGQDGSFRVIGIKPTGPVILTWDRADGTEATFELNGADAEGLVLSDR